jgi:hypothetical protein
MDCASVSCESISPDQDKMRTKIAEKSPMDDGHRGTLLNMTTTLDTQFVTRKDSHFSEIAIIPPTFHNGGGNIINMNYEKPYVFIANITISHEKERHNSVSLSPD